MFMKKIKVIMLALLLAAGTGYSAAYVTANFDSDALGFVTGYTNLAGCTYASPGIVVPQTGPHFIEVIDQPTNTAGTGRGLRIVDSCTNNGVRVQWNLPVSQNSLRYDFSFVPAQAPDAQGANSPLVFGVTTNSASQGTGGNRFADVRVDTGGTIRFYQGTSQFSTNWTQGVKYTISMYLNHSDSSSLTYTTPLGTTTTLGTNCVAYWLSTNGAPAVLVPSRVGGTFVNHIGAPLGEIGFSSGGVSSNLNFYVDNLVASEAMPSSANIVTIVNGSGSGSFDSGSPVTIVAQSIALKTFLAWTGDTGVLSSNTASTTFTMPATSVSLTATYDKSILTINKGAGGGAYTSGAQVAISADAPASWQKFYAWVGDTQYVSSVSSASATVTMPANKDITVTATYTGFFHDFEDETVGGPPAIGNPLMISMFPPSNYVMVVSVATNTAGTGNAVELKDDSVNGLGFEYNITPTTNGLSAARASFAFSWKNIRGDGVGNNLIAASFAKYDPARSMSGSASRYTEARLMDNGTVTIGANGASLTPDVGVTMTALAANTLNAFANDNDSLSVNYTVNGTTYSLPSNSVAYWVNGKLLTFSASESVSMDLTKTTGSGTVGTSSNNLGKFGFSTTSTQTNLNYIIDNIRGEEIPAISLYSMVVNFGGGGGLYTNGQQVVIKANTTAGKSFVKWNGGETYLANSNSATTTVNMPAAGVTVTAVYNVNILTVNNGSGGGEYTNSAFVTITANSAPANQVFVQWGGTGLPYITNPYVTNTTLTMPAQDITVYPIYAGILNGFEGDTTNLPPTVGTPDTANVLVVDASVNLAGTGKAVELIDISTNANSGTGLEYDIASGKPSLSAAKASFAFSWKDVGGTNSDDYIAVVLGEFDSTASRRLGSGVRRFTEARLCKDGTIDFRSDGATTNSTDNFENNNNVLVASNKNTMTIFANDYDSIAVNYTVNGSTYSLPANSVAYWLNGQSILFGTNAYAPMDLAKVTAGGTVGTSEGNLGKFGFASGTADTGLDYIVDDIEVTADKPWDALYSMVVNGGSGGGLYTSGQWVPVAANPGSRTFVTWVGDTDVLDDPGISPATAIMSTNAVTLTAIYTDSALTVHSGSGGGSYTNGQQVPIVASNLFAKTFVAWTGATQYLADSNSASTTVTMPVQDISLTATYVDANYALTVTSGSGSGGSYTNGQQVAISAAAVGGKTFVAWTGDTAYVDNASSASATVTMPAQAVSLAATYVDTTYALTVTSGTGGGSYTNGHVQAIAANAPAPGHAFSQWTGDTVYLTDSNAASTTVMMPAQAVSLTATYIVTEQYTTNGTPYSWLDLHGLTNHVADDALDQDGDGLKTWQEYIASTDPTNATSVLRATQATRNVITWAAQSNRIYSVYWSTNLAHGFTALNTNIVPPQSGYTNLSPDTRVNHYQVRVRMQ